MNNTYSITNILSGDLIYYPWDEIILTSELREYIINKWSDNKIKNINNEEEIFAYIHEKSPNFYEQIFKYFLWVQLFKNKKIKIVKKEIINIDENYYEINIADLSPYNNFQIPLYFLIDCKEKTTWLTTDLTQENINFVPTISWEGDSHTLKNYYKDIINNNISFVLNNIFIFEEHEEAKINYYNLSQEELKNILKDNGERIYELKNNNLVLLPPYWLTTECIYPSYYNNGKFRE